MNVLYLVESAAPYGSNKSLVDLIDRVSMEGVTACVVGTHRGPLSDWLEERHVQYIALGHQLSVYPKAGSWLDTFLFLPKLFAVRALNLFAFARLLAIAHRFKPDIIHTNIGPCTLGFWTATTLGVRHVWHLREYQDRDFGLRVFPTKAIFINLLRRSDAVVCITRDIAKHFSYPGNLHIVADGVAAERLKWQPARKRQRFLFVGRLEEAKGIGPLVSTFLEFCERHGPSFELLVAGDGESVFVKRLKDEALQSRHGSRVQFLGYREDVAQLMETARALIVNSRSEGFGRITCEAMLNGCLVIGRDTGGTSEILDSGSGDPAGLLFSNEAGLMQAMVRATTMPDTEYERLARRASARVMDHYSIEKHAKAMLEVYKLVDKPGPR
ncbi:MAG: glycosyltransferase family 4 protein [Pseudomonadota bacterium]